MRCALFSERALLENCVAESAQVNGSVACHVREVLLSDAILEDEFDPELYPLFEPARAWVLLMRARSTTLSSALLTGLLRVLSGRANGGGGVAQRER